jgi:hypothetical protein
MGSIIMVYVFIDLNPLVDAVDDATFGGMVHVAY